MTFNNAVQAANILLVEDDKDLSELIAMQLTFQGHKVTKTQCLKDADQQLAETAFDLVVLDRGLADGDGADLCQQWRQRGVTLPILILTARDGEMDKVAGLESGADDYMTKPFSVLEFQARVRTLLRRLKSEPSTSPPPTDNSPDLQFSGLTIYPELHKVEIDQQSVTLTANEFALLMLLANRPGRVFSKEEILNQVWETNFSGYHHTVCSTINRLRNKLTSPEYKYVHTVWGVGYKFEVAAL
ncbi:response regulator transcription factor [Thaumasiovibrio subtropicus]|uniref:response regulator transcription factor n=1 Tax=Thaumasiovibrio subtropicus TaxID=1891207 RepID=UPI000B35FB41|nr:response regulator transcription factor [Thaumasiovibrio subtropicus]